MKQQTLEPTDRTRLRRKPDRGSFAVSDIESILDEALICHLGFTVGDQPFVLPTTHARIGSNLFVHGAAASRMLKVVREGVPVCVTVTLLDGLVLARSAMHHSMNYRSVVVLGRATEVADSAEKGEALAALVDRIVPGRFASVRPPSETELKATMVLRVGLTEASAKVRTGPPVDDPADLGWPVWAGVIPLKLNALAPVQDGAQTAATAVPEAVRDYRR